jgi:hypothetical protein
MKERKEDKKKDLARAQETGDNGGRNPIIGRNLGG